MKKLTYNIYRNIFKKTITSHLGKVVETEDKIICFVDKNKVKKESGTYSFPCFGIGNNSLKEDALKLNLDKPICYIIDGFNFDKHRIYIFGYDNCEVIIRNCNFKDVVVHVDGKTTLDNVGIKSIFKNTSISAYDLTLENMDLSNIYLVDGKEFKISGTKKLDITNSKIGRLNQITSVKLYSDNEINIFNSKISGDEIECNTKKITTDKDSLLVSDNSVNINADDFTDINIDSEILTINGIDHLNDKGKISLSIEKDPLRLKRLQLVNQLKKLKDKCIEENSKKVKEYKESLNNKSVQHVLKK